MCPQARTGISVTRLRVAFGGVAAVDNLDLDVANGEVVAVLGPNGSGKTTLLNAITGFVPIDAGTIALDDRDVTRMPTHTRAKLGLGRTFQNLRVVPRVVVGDLLQFGWHQSDPRGFGASVVRPFRLATSTAAARSAGLRALERVGLPSSLLSTPVTSLSQGQLKLVDIARALMAEPRMLLLDEPTSGLSNEDVVHMQGLIAALRQEGITLLVVEHDVRFVLSFADRVVVMETGRALAEGPPHATMRLPAVVDAYLGPRGRSKQDADSVVAGTDSATRSDAKRGVSRADS